MARRSLIFCLFSWPVNHSTHSSARSEGAWKGEGLLQVAGGALGKDMMIWGQGIDALCKYTTQKLELSVFPLSQTSALICTHTKHSSKHKITAI